MTECEKDQQWERACLEIIDRCVAPDMYHQARTMLELAMRAAIISSQRDIPIEFNPD